MALLRGLTPARSTRLGRRARSALCAALLLTSVSSAKADPSLSDRETARSLMDDGDLKRDHADFKAALKSYEAADAIMHVPTTGLEVARTQAQLGLLLEARETLGRVMRLPPRPGEPAPFTAARRTAEQLSADLGARLPSVTVIATTAEPGPPVQLFFDGETVPPAAASAPRKVNPGHHTVVARAGNLERKEELDVGERESRTLTIELKPLVVDPPKRTAPPPAASSPLPKVLIFGGFGLGIVGVGVGSVTGLLSFMKVSDVRKDCNGDACPERRTSDIASAKSLGNVSTVAFIVGGAGVAAGVVGLVLSGREPTPAPGATAKAMRVTPEVGPTWLGVRGAF